MSKHRSGSASCVDRNLLSFSTPVAGTGVRYNILTVPHRARVMVPATLVETHELGGTVTRNLVDMLEQAYIGEERLYNSNTGKQDLPDNLKEETLRARISEDKTTSQFSIWQKYKMSSIGSPENAAPRTPSTGNSSNSNDGKGRLPVQPAQASRFLPLQDQARLHEWSKNVERDADPAVAAVTPVEPEAVEEQGATRRVVNDSDSDAEEMQLSKQPPPATSRQVLADSDDESEVQRGPTAAAAAPPRPLLSLQEERIQAMRVNRTDRNRAAPDPTLTMRPRQTVNTVDSDNFFQDVPKEKDELYAEAQVMPPTPGRGPMVNSQPTRRMRTFDGAADEPDEPARVEQSTTAYSPKPVSFQLSDNEAHTMPSEYAPRGTFDPSRYGLRGRGNRTQGGYESGKSGSSHSPRSNRGRSRLYPSQSGLGASRTNNRPVPSIPGAANDRSRRNKEVLVEITAEGQSSIIKPPPGLTRRSTPPPAPDDELNLLDAPLDEIQRPAIKPSYEEVMYNTEDTSWSASSSSGGSHRRGLQYVPQTVVSRPDVPLMQNTVLQSLMALKAQQSPVREKDSASHDNLERIEEDDEASKRKFYDTMNLKAPKAVSRSKNKGGQQETPAQRQARLDKVKEVLWGQSQPAARSNSNATRQAAASPQPEMSQRGLQAAQNNRQMAALHIDALLQKARQDIAKDLLYILKPVFETVRCFPGEVGLEVQLGQLFVQPSSRIDTRKVYELEKWKSIFCGDNSTTEVRFTNLLTSDGNDIDNLLNMKMGKHKMWHKERPGPADVSIEFKCFDSLSQEFWICLDEHGKYAINRGPSPLSKTAIHCPGKLWDACATVPGTVDLYETTPEFDEEVQRFISSIFVKAGIRIAVHFRQPTSNSLTVQEVVLRRTSLHDCQIPAYDNVQLKVTEVKELTLDNHKTDKRLLRAIEERYPKLADEGRVHYEVAVLHKEINEAFEENLKFAEGQQLEIGDTTFAMAANMLNHERLNMLVQTSLHIVDKIDWVGGKNYGSLVQKNDALEMRRLEMQRSVPPSIHNPTLLRPAYLPSGHSVAGPRTAFGPASTMGTRPFGAVSAPHGIRQNTIAKVWRDEAGNLFHVGIGGARIPIPEDDTGIARTEVVPGDSASQIGQMPSRHLRAKVGNQDHPDSFW